LPAAKAALPEPHAILRPHRARVPVGARAGSQATPISKLADISEVLEELGTRSPIMQSLLETTLVLSVGAWSFRYGLEEGRNRLTVFQAVNGGEL